MFPNPDQQKFLDASENAIVLTARPGRGKTSVAMLRAANALESGVLDSTQNILFLTFSRNAVKQLQNASVAVEALDGKLSRLEIRTYHSLMFWLLNQFGRYSGLPANLRLLTGIQKRQVVAQEIATGKDRLTLGLELFQAIEFESFAPLALDVLENSSCLRSALSAKYPIIIVDEFQDTNEDQWRFIKLISEHSQLICLADPDQMIYGFQGASNDRLTQLQTDRGAVLYELKGPSERSRNNVVLQWAEDILDNRITKGNQLEYRRRLKSYKYPNARGLPVKSAVAGFFTQHKRKVSKEERATIAVVAETNAEAIQIKKQLRTPTKAAKMTYDGTLLGELKELDLAEELLLSTISWRMQNTPAALQNVLRCFGALLNNGNPNAVVRTLLEPSALVADPTKAKANARKILDPLLAEQSGVDYIKDSMDILQTIAGSISSIGTLIPLAALSTAASRLTNVPIAAGDDLKLRLQQLERERTKRQIIEASDHAYSEKNIIFSTMHKLKGREFDYVCIVLPHRDSGMMSDLEWRRLLYVALTRARHDAAIVYSTSYIQPFLQRFLT